MNWELKDEVIKNPEKLKKLLEKMMEEIIKNRNYIEKSADIQKQTVELIGDIVEIKKHGEM